MTRNRVSIAPIEFATAGNVPAGTVFKYTDNYEIYMKLSEDHGVVDLASGMVYKRYNASQAVISLHSINIARNF